MEDLEIPDEVKERIINEVIELFLIPRFIELGMRATSEWEANVHARANEIWGRDYTEYLVNGREPGTMPPVEAIFNWSRAKFGNTDMNVAWAIATKIKQEGTTWYPNGSDLLEVLESREVTDYIQEQLSIFITAQVELKFRRYVQQTLETA